MEPDRSVKTSSAKLADPPSDLNDIFERVFAFLRAILGSSVAILLTGALILIVLLVLAIMSGVGLTF